MSWSEGRAKTALIAVLFGLVGMAISGCQVQPLNATKPTALPGATVAPSELSSVEVLEAQATEPSAARVGQQVRNHLIFGLTGGGHPAGATHTLALRVAVNHTTVAIETSTKAPSAAGVAVVASYTLTENGKNQTVATGIRQTTVAYDRTSQSFANQRASSMRKTGRPERWRSNCGWRLPLRLRRNRANCSANGSIEST